MASIAQLFDDNVKLVYYIVSRKYSTYNFDIREDLVQEGLLALYKASQHFDDSRNTKFVTLAYKYIHTACRNYLTKNRKNTCVRTKDDLSYIEDTSETCSLDDFKILLDDKHFRVLEMRTQGYTDADIAKKIKYSKEYIRQMRKNIGEKCKKLLKS